MLNSGLPLGLARSSASDIAAVVIFATYPLWFHLGTELGLAGHRVTGAQRTRERDRIIRDLAATMYPRGGAIPPGAVDVDSAASVESFMGFIPSLFDDALTVLLFAFDSRFFVLAFTGKWKRFVDLDADESSVWEKGRYIEAWESNTYLMAVAQILKITISYAYYTQAPVYDVIGYNGPMIPNPPSWYIPAPGTTTTTAVTGTSP